MRIDSHAYAVGLHERGAAVLDPHSLHSWMVQRVMLDLGLEHASAVELVDELLEHERAVARRLVARRHHGALLAARLHVHRHRAVAA